MSSTEMRFGFGRNWQDFIAKNFSEERVSIAQGDLLSFLKLDDLQGKYFLDIGCGSGLHSLAALRADAARIVSFDYDSDSVNTTLKLKEFSGNPPQWVVMKGSILDDAFLKTLEPADIVYSWGVLHHTGAMWQAMDNTVRLMKPDALLQIALYDYEIQIDPPAEFWLEVKQRYNRGGSFSRRQMELWYVWRFMLHGRLTGIPALVGRFFTHKQSRGMALYNDIVDWLGGWPMEFAKRADVKAWAAKQRLETLTMLTGKANTEYLFQRVTSSAISAGSLKSI